MRAFRNILVYTRSAGEQEAGVANAIALARRNKSRLRLMDVLIDLPPGWRRLANEVAHEIGADLMVIGTVRRPDVEGLFIGQTAEEILERVRVPVLAMKPAGFVSPVTTGKKETGNLSATGR